MHWWRAGQWGTEDCSCNSKQLVHHRKYRATGYGYYNIQKLINKQETTINQYNEVTVYSNSMNW